jgi:hypothetical protein
MTTRSLPFDQSDLFSKQHLVLNIPESVSDGELCVELCVVCVVCAVCFRNNIWF